jgi:hypothetical protein
MLVTFFTNFVKEVWCEIEVLWDVTLSLGEQFQTCRRNVIHTRMFRVKHFKITGNILHTTPHHVTRKLSHQQNCCDNLRPHTMYTFFGTNIHYHVMACHLTFTLSNVNPFCTVTCTLVCHVYFVIYFCIILFIFVLSLVFLYYLVYFCIILGISVLSCLFLYYPEYFCIILFISVLSWVFLYYPMISSISKLVPIIVWIWWTHNKWMNL